MSKKTVNNKVKMMSKKDKKTMYENNENLMKEIQKARLEQDKMRKYKLYKKLYKNYINNELVKLEYARSCKGIDDEKAEKLLLELTSTRSRSLALLELGKMENEKGNSLSATQKFKSLLSERNKCSALIELGKQAMDDNKISMARQYFEQCLKDGSNDSYAILELGRLESRIGNFEKAHEYLKSLLLTNSREYALFELSDIEIETGNIELARAYLDEMLNSYGSYYALTKLGKLEEKLGNFEKAKEYYTRLLQTEDRKIGLIELVYINLKEGNIDLAYSYFGLILFEYQKNVFNVQDTKNISRLNTYFNHLFGVLKEEDCKDYFSKQLYHYDYNRFMKHLQKHFSSKNCLKFNDNISESEIAIIAKSNLNEKYLRKNNITDTYNISLPYEVASIDGISTNTIEIITIPNSDKILTIYPVFNKYGQKYNLDSKSLIKR